MVAAMEGARSTVRTGEVCYAVRSSVFVDRQVVEGEAIGLLERELVAAGDDPVEVLIDLLRNAGADEDHLVTLYWGDEIDEDGSNRACDRVVTEFPNSEVELVYGGQPGYLFIVSIE